MHMIKSHLASIIEERGLKQKWLSEKAKVHVTTLSKIARGTVPTLEVAFRIAVALDLRVDEIWRYVEDEDGKTK